MFTRDKITLRKIESSDLPDLLYLKNESWFGTHHVAFLTAEDQARWYSGLDNHPTAPRQLIMIAQDENWYNFGVFKLNLEWPKQSAEFGWDVYQNFRGRGLGKKLAEVGVAFCFEVLNLRRINCEILETNKASLKCAEHVNLVVEGCKREAILKNGHPVDSFVLGLLSKEYFFHKENPKPQQ